MKKIWLDTDPGFDDWMAWALLEADPGVELMGVSVVAGNAPLAKVLANARRIAALHGWATPIHAGCERPLAQAQVTAEDVLGQGGLATRGAGLPDVQAALRAEHGVDALIDCVRRHPGQITLLAIAPLTNVATAFARAPDLPALLADLVIMGGSQGAGNTTPVAEFNIYADPEAAAQVFAAAPCTRMFGIEVCRQVQIGAREITAFRAMGSERARIFAGMARALRPGGHLILQGYTPKQLEYRTGGPSAVENLYTAELLREAFAGLEIMHLQEYEDVLEEGVGHKGRSALVGLVARRPPAAGEGRR